MDLPHSNAENGGVQQVQHATRALENMRPIESRSEPSYPHNDLSIGVVEKGATIVWTVWHDPTDTILGEYPDEQAARDAIEKMVV